MRIASIRVRPPQLRVAVLAAVMPVLMIGCGKSGKPVFPVSGSAVHDGKAVTGGGFTFTPIVEGGNDAGTTPVVAPIQSDGTFTMNAAEGKYRVLYSPPTPEVAEPAEGEHVDTSKIPPSPYSGMVPKEQQIELTSGTTEITIELVPASK